MLAGAQVGAGMRVDAVHAPVHGSVRGCVCFRSPDPRFVNVLPHGVARSQEKDWEQSRESRVASWRDFQNKKKVKKNTPELRPPKAVVEDASKSFIKRVNRANE